MIFQLLLFILWGLNENFPTTFKFEDIAVWLVENVVPSRAYSSSVGSCDSITDVIDRYSDSWFEFDRFFAFPRFIFNIDGASVAHYIIFLTNLATKATPICLKTDGISVMVNSSITYMLSIGTNLWGFSPWYWYIYRQSS